MFSSIFLRSFAFVLMFGLSVSAYAGDDNTQLEESCEAALNVHMFDLPGAAILRALAASISSELKHVDGEGDASMRAWNRVTALARTGFFQSEEMIRLLEHHVDDLSPEQLQHYHSYFLLFSNLTGREQLPSATAKTLMLGQIAEVLSQEANAQAVLPRQPVAGVGSISEYRAFLKSISAWFKNEFRGQPYDESISELRDLQIDLIDATSRANKRIQEALEQNHNMTQEDVANHSIAREKIRGLKRLLEHVTDYVNLASTERPEFQAIILEAAAQVVEQNIDQTLDSSEISWRFLALLKTLSAEKKVVLPHDGLLEGMFFIQPEAWADLDGAIAVLAMDLQEDSYGFMTDPLVEHVQLYVALGKNKDVYVIRNGDGVSINNRDAIVRSMDPVQNVVIIEWYERGQLRSQTLREGEIVMLQPNPAAAIAFARARNAN